MQPRVTAILVARNGAEFLGRTLPALASQTRRPDTTVFVDSGSTDSSGTLLAAANPAHLVRTSNRGGFGSAVAQGLHVAASASSVAGSSDDEWIWLLAHDSAPHPRALASLLGAVEIAPSVALAGPKLMRWDRQDTIAEYGETLTRFGASIALVENELDQAQHDSKSDLLGVAASGMLVRRSVWDALGGFDPALTSIDASLDFSVRARLAGHRVVGVPAARVLSAGSPELFGRKSLSAGSRSRVARAAQLHRRLVYSRPVALPLHWLSLLPLAILRSIGHLIRKSPGSIAGEFATALGTAFRPGVSAARRNLKASRRLGWAAIAPLRMPTARAREHRAQQRETSASGFVLTIRTRVGFFSGGGAWMVLIAAVIGIISFGPLITAQAMSGGALAPLTANLGDLWANAAYGWHDIAGGFTGAADPFVAVLAVLGSITFWSPSFSIVLLYLAALPLAALGAWWCAVRFTERAWPPAVAALLWALAPPFLNSLNSGHLGAMLAHLLLPWLAIAVFVASRSWSAAAAAALLFAAVTASAPALAPALVIALVVWMVIRPARVPRLIGVFIPAAALFAPLVVEQVLRGNPLGWLAEPGIAVVESMASGWHLAIGSTDASLSGWVTAAGFFGLPESAAPWLAAGLLAPLGIIAILALFLPGAGRAIPALVLSLLGFLTAVAGTHLHLASAGSEPVSIWPSAGLSLYWLGLVIAIVIALDTLGTAVAVPGLVLVVTAALAVAPLIAAPLAETSDIRPSSTSSLPAFVAAESAGRTDLGTLQLDPQADGGLAVTLHRGTGTTLDELSTLVSTATVASDAQLELATLAGNLASRSGFELAEALEEHKIGFVLLTDAGTSAASQTRQRAADALDGNRLLTPVGDTDAGVLWNFQDLADGAAPVGTTTLDSPVAMGIVGGQLLVFFVVLLLAVPTSRGRGRSNVADSGETAPGFDEDDHV